MASLRVSTGAVSADILSTEDIRLVEQPSILNVACSSVTNGDLIGVRLNKTIIMDDSEVNTIAGDIIDVMMDRIVANSVIGVGQLKLPVSAVTTELQAWLQVEPILVAEGISGNGFF